ncbi:MAG: SDR family oxidoreductase [Pseudomonadota bacterium]
MNPSITLTRTCRSLFGLLSLLALTLGASPVLADSHAGGAAGDTKIVLITGANRGLGLEFAKQYADDGWTVIGTARSPAKADELKAVAAEMFQLDVTDRASIAALAKSLDGRPIDMLINNAGIFPRVGEIEKVDADDYARTLLVNTLGPVLVTQALLPNLRAGDMKHIVNITSQLASIENNGGNFYGYRESKAGLNMFTKTLAAELEPEGFVCLALHPGWVRTDMGGPSATLSPEESVSAMRDVISSVSTGDSGQYRAYTGAVVPW